MVKTNYFKILKFNQLSSKFKNLKINYVCRRSKRKIDKSNKRIFFKLQVVARLVVSTRPAITLGELMTEDQLLRLITLATGPSDSAWVPHAVSCLLQDLLEGKQLRKK